MEAIPFKARIFTDSLLRFGLWLGDTVTPIFFTSCLRRGRKYRRGLVYTSAMIRNHCLIWPEADPIRSFEDFKKYFHVLKPVLRLVGVDVSTPEAAYEHLREKLPPEGNDGIPDICHKNFASRGWVLYGEMDRGLVARVDQAVRHGRMNDAEDLLIGHCDAEHILQQLENLRRFASRDSDWELIQRAFQDFLENRYDSCIPLVLIATDKLVEYVYERNFDVDRAAGAVPQKARAWESFASFSRGMQWLKAIALEDGRTVGMDLYYRNLLFRGIIQDDSDRVVAAKAWTMLFAVGEWARKLDEDRQCDA